MNFHFSIVNAQLEDQSTTIARRGNLMSLAQATARFEFDDGIVIEETAPLWMIFTEVRSALGNAVLYAGKKEILLLDQPIVLLEFDVRNSVYIANTFGNSQIVYKFGVDKVRAIVAHMRDILCDTFGPISDILSLDFEASQDPSLFDLLSTLGKNGFRGPAASPVSIGT